MVRSRGDFHAWVCRADAGVLSVRQGGPVKLGAKSTREMAISKMRTAPYAPAADCALWTVCYTEDNANLTVGIGAPDLVLALREPHQRRRKIPYLSAARDRSVQRAPVQRGGRFHVRGAEVRPELGRRLQP